MINFKMSARSLQSRDRLEFSWRNGPEVPQTSPRAFFSQQSFTLWLAKGQNYYVIQLPFNAEHLRSCCVASQCHQMSLFMCSSAQSCAKMKWLLKRYLGCVGVCICVAAFQFLSFSYQIHSLSNSWSTMQKKKEKKKESITHTLPCKYNVINATEEVWIH